MVMASIFQRPRARPPLASTSSQQNLVDVSNEDELLAALTSLPRSDGACYGRGVNIVADIALRAPVRLSRQHSGITITSSSAAKISSKKQMSAAFIVNAELVNIENITIAPPAQFTSIVEIQSFAFNQSRGIRISRISFSGAATTDNLVLFPSSNTAPPTEIEISNNFGPQNDLATFVSIIRGAVTLSTIVDNKNFNRDFEATLQVCNVSRNIYLGAWTDPSSGDGSISNVFANNIQCGGVYLLDPVSGFNVIMGNTFIGSDINTAASQGYNSIIGNTLTGTITNAATDAVTSNT